MLRRWLSMEERPYGVPQQSSVNGGHMCGLVMTGTSTSDHNGKLLL